MKQFSGYIKNNLTNSNVLLAEGGDKALSTFIGSLDFDTETRTLRYKSAAGELDWTAIMQLGARAMDSTAYLPLAGGTMSLGEGLKFHADENYFGTNLDARIISLIGSNSTTCDGGLIIDERCTSDGTEYVTELLRIRDNEFKWKGTSISLDGHNHDARYVNIDGDTMTGPITLNYSASSYSTTYDQITRYNNIMHLNVRNNILAISKMGTNGLLLNISGISSGTRTIYINNSGGFLPESNNTAILGGKNSEYGETDSRVVFARHLNGSRTYNDNGGNMDLYLNHVGTTLTQGNVYINGDSNGLVGIGTTSPTCRLHVEGSEYVSNNISVAGYITGSGSSNRLIFRHIDGQNCNGNYDLYLNYHNGDYWKVYLCGNTYYVTGSLAYLPSIRTGSTFIGSNAIGFNRNTTNGDTFNSSWYGGQIHVDGGDGTMVFGLNTGSGSYHHDMYLYHNGNLLLLRGNYYTPSDIRYKKDITEKVPTKTLVYKSFTLKSTETKSYGLIAQEVEEIYPELVSTTKEGYKSINYHAALSLSIAQLLKENEELKDKIRELENRINEMV